MAYVKITNGNVVTLPYTVGQLRRDNPNTSFPKNVPDEILSDYGVYPVTENAFPDYDEGSQKIERQSPVVSEGNWTVSWSIVSKSQDEIDQYDQLIADKNRFKRNQLLADTDYFALTDVTMDASMTSFRQTLRDITDHASWPNLNDEDWPTKPE